MEEMRPVAAPEAAQRLLAFAIERGGAKRAEGAIYKQTAWLVNRLRGRQAISKQIKQPQGKLWQKAYKAWAALPLVAAQRSQSLGPKSSHPLCSWTLECFTYM